MRVSGPFTVEGVQPPEMSLSASETMATGVPVDEGGGMAGGMAGGFAGGPDALEGTFGKGDGEGGLSVRFVEPQPSLEVVNLNAYLDLMTRSLRLDGVRFPNNKQMAFARLEPVSGDPHGFHAEGVWGGVGESVDATGPADVGVVFGPQYGPVTVAMVEHLIKPASRRYSHLVIAGFSFTAEAQAIIAENVHPKLKLHIAHIRPDLNPGMQGLLKEPPRPGSGQLFTVFGLPRIAVEKEEEEYTVTMEGVDIYDPVHNEVYASKADKVAAWFLDGDYDGRTFCVTQAFFPNKDAWEKLAKALNGKDGLIDAERFAAFSGTTSLPFPAGKHRRVAVKVIDPRGNEVMAVETLPEKVSSGKGAKR